MKALLANRTLNNWLGFLFALMILLITIFVSNYFVSELKEEENLKIETYAKAIETYNSELDLEKNESLNGSVNDFLLFILQNNNSIPTIVLDEDNTVNTSVNVSDEVLNDPEKLKRLIKQMKLAHKPMEINYLGLNDEPIKQYLIYENSTLLTKLQYYPIILIILIMIFVFFSFWYFRTLKNTQQSFLWAGMAKETAHQIGTPLSSLIGWMELLKLENVDPTVIKEMEFDINRLNQITERFSKIGSSPQLSNENIILVTEEVVNYLKPRTSKNVNLNFKSDKNEHFVALNKALFGWVIENLIKNAIDAMKNKGLIDVEIIGLKNQIEIIVRDNGPGISSRLHKRIFEPGFTTKKRGWGLGLSLAKRIVQDYHKGKIKVLKSDKNGTTFQILIPA